LGRWATGPGGISDGGRGVGQELGGKAVDGEVQGRGVGKMCEGGGLLATSWGEAAGRAGGGGARTRWQKTVRGEIKKKKTVGGAEAITVQGD
jgi:hypothetical protein